MDQDFWDCFERFSFPKQAQKSRSFLSDRSRRLELVWKGKIVSDNKRNMVLYNNIYFMPFGLMKYPFFNLLILASNKKCIL